LNRVNTWLFRRLCKKIGKVLIGETADSKEPVITFFDERGRNFASLWLKRSKIDDTTIIRTITPY